LFFLGQAISSPVQERVNTYLVTQRTFYLVQEKRLLFLSRRKDSFSCPGEKTPFLVRDWCSTYTFAGTGLQRLDRLRCTVQGAPLSLSLDGEE
jgi:hypothetical protein